jgi:hypothetical protein
MDREFDVVEFEKNNKNLKFVGRFGKSVREVSLYFNSDDGKYYYKGPFGRWDAVSYFELTNVTSDEDALKWLNEMKILNYE